MKCPHCGHEERSESAGKKYREAVESRLVDYGYPEHMTPPKSQAASAVRKVVTLLTGIPGRAGGSMSADDANKSIYFLNIILPKQEEAQTNG